MVKRKKKRLTLRLKIIRAKRKTKKLNKGRKFIQTGSSNLTIDRKRSAKKAGYRVSKTGKIYYEARRKRSDTKFDAKRK